MSGWLWNGWQKQKRRRGCGAFSLYHTITDDEVLPPAVCAFCH